MTTTYLATLAALSLVLLIAGAIDFAATLRRRRVARLGTRLSRFCPNVPSVRGWPRRPAHRLPPFPRWLAEPSRH